MKAWIALPTLFLCWTVVLGFPGEVVPLKEQNYEVVIFFADSYDVSTYTIFLNDLRGKLKSGSSSHSIPLLRTNVPVDSDKRFVLVELHSRGFVITLALDATNASVQGFNVVSNSYFFNDVSDEIYNSKLFDGTQKHKLPFGGSYDGLKAAGASRLDVKLDIYELNTAITKLNHYDDHTTKEAASSLLVAIQFVTEAARLKYVEDKLDKNFKSGINLKGDTISIQDAWAAISVAVQKSNANGLFPHPIPLVDEQCGPYTVKNVDDVKSWLALLLGVDATVGLKMTTSF